ncbi:2Fe-2S iron-sulfur cluster-binding protein, partial [Cribrihabitans sp. XS_ASV171]
AHMRVKLPDGGDRAYSLIHFGAVPGLPDDYRIAVQLEEESTGGSSFMHGLEVGQEVTASAPKCDFPVTPDAPAVLLAGGIGITPMISMAAELKSAGTPVELHYAVRSRALMAYGEELTDHLGEALHLHCDDDDSALELDALIADLGARHFYICGPRGLIDAARAKAEAAGVPADRVHVELFDYASAGAAGDEAFEVEIASTGEVVQVPADKTIIEALEEAGHDLIYDCQRGDCGICQTDVLEGVPDHRDVVLSEEERASGKIMQICVSRAKTPRLKLDL